MEKSVRLNASAVSRRGMNNNENSDNFYLNGRFVYYPEIESTHISFEKDLESSIFCLWDNMDVESDEDKSSISVVKELYRYDERIKVNSGDIKYKIDELKERVDEINNLIHSMSLKDEENGKRILGFSGLIISDNKAAALNIGSNRVYLFRDGNIKHMTVDYSKAKRLLKLGIITDDQAETLNKKFGIPTEEDKEKIQVSELVSIKPGDVFLLCSDGLSDFVSDETMEDVLSRDMHMDYIPGMLVKEAVRNGSDDDVSVAIIKVQDTSSEAKIMSNRENYVKNKPSKKFKKNENLVTYIAAICTGIIIIFMLIGLYNWVMGDNNNDPKEVFTPTNPPSTATPLPNGDDNTPQATPTPSGEEGNEAEVREYTVQSGDSLSSISRKFYGDDSKWQMIKEYNNLESDIIKVGQELLIP